MFSSFSMDDNLFPSQNMDFHLDLSSLHPPLSFNDDHNSALSPSPHYATTSSPPYNPQPTFNGLLNRSNEANESSYSLCLDQLQPLNDPMNHLSQTSQRFHEQPTSNTAALNFKSPASDQTETEKYQPPPVSMKGTKCQTISKSASTVDTMFSASDLLDNIKLPNEEMQFGNSVDVNSSPSTIIDCFTKFAANGRRITQPATKRYINFMGADSSKGTSSSISASTAQTSTDSIQETFKNSLSNSKTNDETSTVSSTSEMNNNRRKEIKKVLASPQSEIDKLAERRRRNRESSSRCYYNRKKIIDSLDAEISSQKRRVTELYDQALKLRHENSRLKRDVVIQGIHLPARRHHVQIPNRKVPVQAV